MEGELVVAQPYKACKPLTNAAAVKGKLVLLERGDCMFIDKARVIQLLGAIGGIVVDNSLPEQQQQPESADNTTTSNSTTSNSTSSSSSNNSPPMFAMSGDNSADDVIIPMVFLFAGPARELMDALTIADKRGEELSVLLADMAPASKLGCDFLTGWRVVRRDWLAGVW